MFDKEKLEKLARLSLADYEMSGKKNQPISQDEKSGADLMEEVFTESIVSQYYAQSMASYTSKPKSVDAVQQPAPTEEIR